MPAKKDLEPENNPTQKYYKDQFRALLRSVGANRKFIKLRDLRVVCNSLHGSLDEAGFAIQKKEYFKAIHICTALLEVLTKALYYADDSNGDIGSVIGRSMEVLNTIAAQDLPEPERKFLFKYCIKAWSGQQFFDWDWHEELLALASSLITSKKEGDVLIKLLDSIEQSQFDILNNPKLKYDILLKVMGEEEATAFLYENLGNAKMRNEAIEIAFNYGDLDHAIDLADKGIHQDRQDRPGQVLNWFDWLLKIALEQSDLENSIEYARLLFIANSEVLPYYYSVLKNLVSIDEWEGFIEEMIEEILAAPNRYDNKRLEFIFREEGMWDRLVSLLRERLSIYAIRDQETVLLQHRPTQLADLYADGILAFMKEKVGRNYYQGACSYIKRLIKLGFPEKASEVANSLRELYPFRTALIEEINKINLLK